MSCGCRSEAKLKRQLAMTDELVQVIADRHDRMWKRKKAAEAHVARLQKALRHIKRCRCYGDCVPCAEAIDAALAPPQGAGP